MPPPSGVENSPLSTRIQKSNTFHFWTHVSSRSKDAGRSFYIHVAPCSVDRNVLHVECSICSRGFFKELHKRGGLGFHRRRTQLPALATGLAQGPVRDGGTGTHRSLPAGGGLPSPYRAPGLGHLSALPQRRRDDRASGVPVSGPRSRQEGHLARRHLHNRSATPLELPGTDWGSDPPPSPPTGNEREREIGSQQEVLKFQNKVLSKF